MHAPSDSTLSSTPPTHSTKRDGQTSRVATRNKRRRKSGWTGLIRFFRNETNPPFIRDPYLNLIREEDGERVQRTVGFQELFYDLFMVAALSVFTKENNLNDGQKIASFVLYFAALWTTWAAQTTYDVRYGGKDGLMWLIAYLQIALFGTFAAISGDFNISLGIVRGWGHHDTSSSDWQQPHYVRVATNGLDEIPATKRAYAVFAFAFALSRLLLALQYGIVTYFAKKRGRDTSSPMRDLIAALVSAALWIGAIGASWSESSGAASARIILWTVGILVELISVAFAAVTSTLTLDLAYWCERFAAFTLIVIGEGIIQLFEAFQKVMHGASPHTGLVRDGAIIGQLVAATGLIGLLYYYYFGYNNHHLRGKKIVHGLYGAIHFPLHLALLLVLQAVVHVIKATTLGVQSTNLNKYFDGLTGQLGNLSNSATVADWAVIMLQSEDAKQLSQIAASISVQFPSRMLNTITYANGNLTQLDNLVQGEEYNLLVELFAFYGFSASMKVYGPMNNLLVAQNISSPQVAMAFDQYLTVLLKPVLESSIYVFTCLGGFFLCISLLQLCRHEDIPSTSAGKRTSHKLHIGIRFFVAVVLLLLTLLDLGHYYRSIVTGSAAPIYRFAGTSYYLPTIFLIALLPGIIDFLLFLWRNGNDGGENLTDKNEDLCASEDRERHRREALDSDRQVNSELHREKGTTATDPYIHTADANLARR